MWCHLRRTASKLPKTSRGLRAVRNVRNYHHKNCMISRRTQSRTKVGASLYALQMSNRRYVSNPSVRAMNLEEKFGAHNYHPLPVVLKSGKGVNVWDVDGKEYLDFLSAYSAVNQGHCHPRIVGTLVDQAESLTLTSRAFYNDLLGEYCEYMTQYFDFDRVLPMNTGVEACESAVKIARRWAYEKKNVADNEAIIIFAENNFWGRSIAAISASTDPESYANYGPFVPGFKTVPYNDIGAIQAMIEQHADKLAAVMLEPVQGEAGVVIPDKEYLKTVRQLCSRHNALLICDEVQCGLGRCGAETASMGVFDVKPDLVTLGKALSGGVYPVSAVLGTDETVGVLTPGTHGSTYGGNPVACRVAMTALDVLRDEKMCENSAAMGKILLNGLQSIQNDFPSLVNTVRGCGLFCAMEIETDDSKGVNAWEICLKMKDRGLLAKPTHGHIVRLSPPLVINEAQIAAALDIIRDVISDANKL